MNIQILQLSRDNEMGFLFEPWDRIEDDFDFDNYVEVWNGTLESLGVTVPSTNNIWNLDKIFGIFNYNHPHNFKGHSLSVSDIVKLDDKYFYCDSLGWENITDKI